MNRTKWGTSNFARTRRALLACFLGLGIAALWSGAAQGWTVYILGRSGFINSATDDGGGRIRVSWYLKPPAPNTEYAKEYPDKVCVSWRVVTNGKMEAQAYTDTCFTSETPTQSDLVVDTGIGADGPNTVYSLVLLSYYNNKVLYPVNDGAVQRVQVTLNAS